MKNAIVAAAALSLVSFGALRALAQAPSSPPATPANTANSKPSEIPRMSDGRPNLQGLWHNEVGAEALRKAGLGDIHSPGTPLPFPYFPITQKIKDYRELRDPYHDPEAHCHVPGVPRDIEQPSSIMPFRIFQDEHYVTILF